MLATVDWLGDFGAAFFAFLYDVRLAALVAGVVGIVGLAWVARRRHWLAAARRHPGRAAAVLVPVLAVGIPLSWYMASPLVLSASIDEPAPSGFAAAAPSRDPAPSIPIERPSASTIVNATPVPPTAAPQLALAGSFRGSDDFHFGRGTARLVETAPGGFVVRLEDFAVRNGPDLYVYISPDATGYAKGAIELGRLKADTGNQNYTVPAGALTDPARAASIVIWCKQFSHLFATAPLAPA